MEANLEAAPSVQPESRPTRTASTAKGTRLSCVNCRKRKIKCDRKEPYCTNCEKHQDVCMYPLERKRVVRRSAYKDMAQRLEKMERLISDFAIEPKSLDNSASPPAGSESSESSKDKIPKINASSILPSIEESDFSWATEIPNELGPREPYREDRFHAHFQENGYQNTAGAASIFSPTGVNFVNKLLGDDSFSQMLATLKPVKKSRQFEIDASIRYPFPPRDVFLACVSDYMATINDFMGLFYPDAIMKPLQAYLDGSTNQGIAWYTAINIILTHSTWSNPNLKSLVLPGDPDQFLYNALSAIPTLLLRPGNELSIGAVICIAMFFMFTFENESAVTILPIAIQQMSLHRYHSQKIPQGVTELQHLQRRRLFYHAFCLDSDLSLRLGKPPVINDGLQGQIVDLPEKCPIDGRGVMTFAGQSFNFLREHVALAKLENKTYSLLYSEKRGQQSLEEVYACIDELDEDLQQWRDGVPDMIRPQQPLDRSDFNSLICTTVLHYTYYQLMIAIHSATLGVQPEDYTGRRDERIIPSVALCVGAARASISLLNYHDNSHPFTVFLINHVAWSVDILFMNILHNKSNPRVYEDLELLEKILDHYEKHDEKRSNKPVYQVTRTLYRIASKAVKKSQGGLERAGLNSSSINIKLDPDQISTAIPPNLLSSGNISGGQLPTHMDIPSMNITPSISDPSMNSMAWTNPGVGQMNLLDPEWMSMPMGFQPEYWQDQWANVFQDHDMSDLSLQSGAIPPSNQGL